MAELAVHMTYGQAFYDAAKDLGREKQLLDEAKQVQEILRQEPSFVMLINDPTIPAKEKKQLVKNVFEKSVSAEIINLFGVLIDKRRTREFIKIVDYSAALLEKAEGRATGIVFAVKELTEKQLEKLEEETGKLLRETVKLKQEVDKSLIGGVKILINGKIIDASLKARLEDIASQLIG